MSSYLCRRVYGIDHHRRGLRSGQRYAELVSGPLDNAKVCRTSHCTLSLTVGYPAARPSELPEFMNMVMRQPSSYPSIRPS